ncbi:peptidoglycan-binding domain-containing protein [Methylobacter marinus]|uniref:peptidoglycan-binding domain-containing protein n=1 Tax=Methylobacter marinus TaxID=34058 RepID=UPI0018DE31F7|nr:peptidoglycan-binding protein [Methylobacter marinus]
MKIDGIPTPGYREYVQEFQFAYASPQTGHMDSGDQNKMIKANHLTPEYVVWLQESLNTTGAGMGLTPDGIFGSNTRTAVLSFQSYQGLIDDGWVGAKTETELIKEVGIKPPGEITGVLPKPPVPKPKPKPVNPHDPLTPEQRYDRVINSVYYEALYQPSTYPNKEQRKRLLCFLNKLKKKSGIDDDYIPADRVTRYVRSSGYGYNDGVLPDRITSSAKDHIKSMIKWLPYEDRNDREKLRTIILNIYYAIESGLTRISSEYNVWGDASNSAKALNNWGMKKQNNKNSILSCFK